MAPGPVVRSQRGFSILEALIAVGLVLLALVGLFAVMPYTYRAMRDDSLRVEATSAAQQFMDRVRIAVQSGLPVPGPENVQLDLGQSFVTGETSSDKASLDLTATCTQPDGPATSLYDCTVTMQLTTDGVARSLSPVESYVTRQLP